jgi:hypothetical protein
LVLGVVSHGEPRFVFFPLALVAVGAVGGAIDVTARWRLDARRGARLALSLLLVGSLALSIATTRSSVENRILSNEPVELSADLVEEMSEGERCAVMTSYTPQVTFYSECFTDIFRTGSDPDRALERLDGDQRFMVLIEDGKRQPVGEDLAALVAETVAGPIPVVGERDSAVVYEFAAG